ncbi:hypothetical protein JCM6882_008145 [Rhodosporidiobolus microsporus]
MPRDLPPELVVLMLEHLVPSVQGEWDDTDGHKALSKSCLVSRAWRDIALPLLHKVVVVNSTLSFNETALARLKSPAAIDLVHAIVGEDAELPAEDFEIALENQQSISCIRLANVNFQEFVAFSMFSFAERLRRLDLSGTSLYIDELRPPPFLHLTELSLKNLLLPRAVLEELLTPACTPALRAVALRGVQDPSTQPGTGLPSYLPSFTPTNVERLAVVMVNRIEAHSHQLPSACPFLMRHSSTGTILFPADVVLFRNSRLPPHLFLDFNFGPDNLDDSLRHRVYQHVRRVRTALEENPSLQTLVLSPWLDWFLSNGEDYVEEEGVRLLKACEKHRVVVLKVAEAERYSFSVPTSFYCHARALKQRGGE